MLWARSTASVNQYKFIELTYSCVVPYWDSVAEMHTRQHKGEWGLSMMMQKIPNSVLEVGLDDPRSGLSQTYPFHDSVILL